MPRAINDKPNQDRETPQWLFRLLDDEFSFTLDGAADESNAKCDEYLDEGIDALSVPWDDDLCDVIWINPPYGRGRDLEAWVHKAWQESQDRPTVVMLLPASVDTHWWHDYVLDSAEIRFINGRLKFDDLPGPGWFANVIVIFRPGQDKAFLGPAINARGH